MMPFFSGNATPSRSLLNNVMWMMTYEHCNNYDEQAVVGEEQNEEKETEKAIFIILRAALFVASLT